MKGPSVILLAAGLALALTLSALPASSQQAQQPAPLKPASPSALAAARDLLTVKNVSQVYASAVPNIVQRTKDAFLANNLSYQKDLNEVALVVAQNLAGREKEIGEQMAKIYASDFTEQELKDLTAFYKTPIGQKLLNHISPPLCKSPRLTPPEQQVASHAANLQPVSRTLRVPT